MPWGLSAPLAPTAWVRVGSSTGSLVSSSRSSSSIGVTSEVSVAAGSGSSVSTTGGSSGLELLANSTNPTAAAASRARSRKMDLLAELMGARNRDVD